MEIVKIIGIGFITLIIVLILKEYKKEYAVYALIISGIIVLTYSMNTISEIVNFIKNVLIHANFVMGKEMKNLIIA